MVSSQQGHKHENRRIPIVGNHNLVTLSEDYSRLRTCTVVVLRADSPGEAAQWFAESIPES
jgi:hypothetical protein